MAPAMLNKHEVGIENIGNIFAQESSVEGIGIGRVISRDWISDFACEFTSRMPDDTRFDMRRSPGVSYMSGEELKKLDPGSNANFQAERIKVLLDAFQSEELIDPETALQKVEVPLIILDYIHNKQSVTIRLKASDKPSSFYESGYLIDGEKKSIRAELGMEDPHPSNPKGKMPKNIVKLGLVTGNRNFLSPHFMKKVRKMLSSTIEFSPVGVIQSDLRQVL